jgi:hypothetical protein
MVARCGARQRGVTPIDLRGACGQEVTYRLTTLYVPPNTLAELHRCLQLPPTPLASLVAAGRSLSRAIDVPSGTSERQQRRSTAFEVTVE